MAPHAFAHSSLDSLTHSPAHSLRPLTHPSAHSFVGLRPPHSLRSQYIGIVWLIFVLLIGTMWQYLTSRVKFLAYVPYTSAVMVLGIILGVAHRGTDCGLLYLSQSIHSWSTINSHLLLYIFLPLLLFADSMGLKWHLVKSTLWQCLLLATVGVVIGTFLTAIVAKYVLPYDFTWNQSWMLGSILAATDPVAVVGLLKSLGASPVLTMQIAGESLFNDGVAIVLFNVFYTLVIAEFAPSDAFPGHDIMIDDKTHPAYTEDSHHVKNSTISVAGAELLFAGYFTATFLWMFFFALIWGIVVGFAFYILIYFADRPHDHNDSQLQIVYTITMAFMAYVIGEGVCKASGVLSAVFAGVVTGAVAWPSFVDKSSLVRRKNRSTAAQRGSGYGYG